MILHYAVPAWSLPTVPVAGRDELFPVRHIYCVGRNYAEHAKEMGGDAAKEPPFFFAKAADAVVPVVPPAPIVMLSEADWRISCAILKRASRADSSRFIFVWLSWDCSLPATRTVNAPRMTMAYKATTSIISTSVNPFCPVIFFMCFTVA